MASKRLIKVTTELIKVTTEFGTFQRQTARAYQYFVITSGETREKLGRYYASKLAHDMKHLAEYEGVLAAMDAAGAPFASKIDGNSINEANMLRDNGWKPGHVLLYASKAESEAGSGGFDRATWQKFADGIRGAIADSAQRLANRIAEVEARSVYDVQWSTRLELARKYASELRERGFENVKVIEVATGKEVL